MKLSRHYYDYNSPKCIDITDLETDIVALHVDQYTEICNLLGTQEITKEAVINHLFPNGYISIMENNLVECPDKKLKELKKANEKILSKIQELLTRREWCRKYIEFIESTPKLTAYLVAAVSGKSFKSPMIVLAKNRYQAFHIYNGCVEGGMGCEIGEYYSGKWLAYEKLLTESEFDKLTYEAIDLKDYIGRYKVIDDSTHIVAVFKTVEEARAFVNSDELREYLKIVKI